MTAQVTGRRTIVYIDGFNLFYGALKGQGSGVKWLDLRRLCRRLLPDNDIVLIRYFARGARHHGGSRQSAYHGEAEQVAGGDILPAVPTERRLAVPVPLMR